MAAETHAGSRAERNVAFIRKHLADANKVMDHAGSIDNLDFDLYQTYSEETVFFCLGREFHGIDGIKEFLKPLAGYKQVLGDILDIFASDDRVCLVIEEQMLRVADGKTFDFERIVIYKVVDEIITECWISDRPATWGLETYGNALHAEG